MTSVDPVPVPITQSHSRQRGTLSRKDRELQELHRPHEHTPTPINSSALTGEITNCDRSENSIEPTFALQQQEE